MPAMATAYAKWINKHGGINGRKLKVLTCNDHNTACPPRSAPAEAVEENVVAVVGSYSEFSDSYFAPLEGAGIPYIGGYGVTTRSSPAPCPTPSTAASPRSWPASARNSPRPAAPSPSYGPTPSPATSCPRC
jgi:ABC-type branched-subunit amino acid transport system substrate-binding protein